jgi:hypothetical protein
VNDVLTLRKSRNYWPFYCEWVTTFAAFKSQADNGIQLWRVDCEYPHSVTLVTSFAVCHTLPVHRGLIMSGIGAVGGFGGMGVSFGGGMAAAGSAGATAAAGVGAGSAAGAAGATNATSANQLDPSAALSANMQNLVQTMKDFSSGEILMALMLAAASEKKDKNGGGGGGGGALLAGMALAGMMGAGQSSHLNLQIDAPMTPGGMGGGGGMSINISM